jgi:hypothetical protein
VDIKEAHHALMRGTKDARLAEDLHLTVPHNIGRNIE